MKNFKRIVALSLVLIIFSTFSACKLFSAEETTTKLSKEDLLTMTDPEGVGRTDYQGNTLENVDAGEEISKFDNDQEVVSEDGNPTTKVVKTTQKDSSATTGSSGGQSVTLPQVNNFNTIQQEFFAKGIFTLAGTMSVEVSGTEMNMPFKFAMNGTEKYMSGEYTLYGTTVGILMNNKKTYMLIPGLKLYQEMDGGGLADLDDFSGLTSTTTHASTKKVKIGDDIYICEERKSSDGNSTYFYFLDGTLARIKFESSDGGVSLMKVDSLKASVDKSEFDIPAGYNKANLEELANK